MRYYLRKHNLYVAHLFDLLLEGVSASIIVSAGPL
jgi:hypothetical protein